MDFSPLGYFFLSGRVLCDGPIPCPEESYPVCVYVYVCVCVSLSVIRCHNNHLHTRGGRKAKTKKARIFIILTRMP
jgi:hypothetical protein